MNRASGRFKAAFFGGVTLALLFEALPAQGQAQGDLTPADVIVTSSPSPSPSGSALPPTPQPSGLATPMTAPFPNEGPTAVRSPVPIVPPSPGTTPVPVSPTPAPGSTATPKPTKIQTRSDQVLNQRHEGIATLRGNVHVDYGAVKIDAEEIHVDQNKHEIYTDTRFRLEQPDTKTPGQTQIVTGTGIRYNYDTEESTVYDANVSTPAEAPGQQIYIRAKKVKGQGQDRFDAEDAVFTTCTDLLDEKVPHYHVESRSLQYYAGDRIVAWDNKVYINGKYTFWLPVVVIPLKQDGLQLDAGRTDIEGFYIRSSWPYELPALANGYFLNRGRVYGAVMEKKGLGAGIEHTINWGYAGTTYGYFYGLASPDRENLLAYDVTQRGSQEAQDLQVKREQALLGLYGGPFQDHQFSLEHRQRLIGNMEADGKFEDDNIYDPVTPNYRVNRQIIHGELKDNIAALNGLTYNVAYDGTDQRSNQAITQQYTDSLSQRVTGNISGKAGNTTLQLNNDYSRQHSTLVAFASPSPGASADPNDLTLQRTDQGGTDNLTTNTTVTTQWNSNVTTTVTVPYRLAITETPAPTPGASTSPAPVASPWNQNIEPDVRMDAHIPNVGQLTMDASKYFDLTQPVASASPLTPEAQAAAIAATGKVDKLPEFTLSSDPFFQNIQPVTLKLTYGRYFDASQFKYDPANPPPGFTGTFDRYFPGNYIDRIYPDIHLGSRGQDIGLKSHLDFNGTGLQQYFYSTGDEQYSIDERVRLTTDWTDKVQTNLNYVNNLTPDKHNYPNGQGGFGDPGTPTNNSPFGFDRIGIYKQTALTGDFDVRNDPWLNYTFNWGYDYINHQYNQIQNNFNWRTTIPGVGFPLGIQLSAPFQPLKQDDGSLKLLSKPLDIRYLPKVPLYGIDGTWQPVTGTIVLRSQTDVFGGAFGSDAIIPGWQFDTQAGYDFNTGMWQNLNNRLYIIFGDKWQNHLELMLGGYYDVTNIPGVDHSYKLSQFGISKDLHDFILSFQYDRIQSYYSLNLTMVAFPSKPVNFSSNSFNRLSGGASATGGF